jgi:hypothetical protein
MIAYIALALWPVATIVLFATMPPTRALIWSVLGAYLLLPVKVSYEIPLIPTLDKTSIANLSILLCCFLFVREKWLGVFGHRWLITLMLLFILSPFLTAMGNGYSLQFADRFIPAMTMYDAFAAATVNFITLIPFIVGYGLLRTEKRHMELLSILMVAVLAYSLLMLIEIRLSPQLHRWVYGFFPHSFGQQMRADGFRPVVFIGHGLLVAILCAMGMAAAIARWRLAKKSRKPAMAAAAGYLWILLILCKSLGAAILVFIWAPALAFLRAKRVLLLAALTCFAILLYPGARSLGLVPTQIIANAANAYSDDRGGSLGVRLRNEDALLARTAQKPFFGWGSWGRNRVYSDEDGSDQSVTDGAWIIVLSTWGWVGYIATFGLLCFGATRFLFDSNARRQAGFATASLAVILAINLMDSIPNASIRPISWLLAGTLAVRLVAERQRSTRELEPEIRAGET